MYLQGYPLSIIPPNLKIYSLLKEEIEQLAHELFKGPIDRQVRLEILKTSHYLIVDANSFCLNPPIM